MCAVSRPYHVLLASLIALKRCLNRLARARQAFEIRSNRKKLSNLECKAVDNYGLLQLISSFNKKSNYCSTNLSTSSVLELF